MTAWLASLLAGLDLWLWIGLAVSAALIVALWLFPALPTATRVIGTGVIVTVVTIGLLYSAWQGAEARAADATSEAELERRARKTAEQHLDEERAAALERAADQRTLDTLSKEVNHAIDEAEQRAPGAAPGPATVALGCQRLQQAGATASAEYQRICGRRAGAD